MPRKRSRIKLRKARQSDYEFAESLYVETMEPLLTRLQAWNEREAILRFKGYFVLDEVRIITVDGTDVGWLQISESEEELSLVQLHIEAPFRSGGIGSRLLQDLLNDGRAKRKPVTLSVVRHNQALALYRRFGFEVVEEDDTKLHMRWDHSPDARLGK